MEKQDKFGYFSKDGKEYILKNINTPRPWIHYLSNDKYCVLFSQSGNGFSFYKALHAFKVTYFSSETYTPTHPETGRFIYVRDNDTNKYWFLNPQVDDKHKNFRCHYGLGYVKIFAENNKISSEFRIFVPLEDPCEIWTIKLKNKDSKERSIDIFPYVQWYLSNYPSTFTDPQVYKRAYFNKKYNSIITYNFNPENLIEYGAFMTSSEKIKGYDCSKRAFIGCYGDIKRPSVLVNGENCHNTDAGAEPDIGVLQHRVILKPGSEKEINILIGVIHSEKEIPKYMRRYLSSKNKVEHEFKRLNEYWETVIKKVEINTPDKEFNDRINIWIKYQLHQTFRWTRGLDRGYRDVLQDIRGFIPLGYEKTKSLFLKTLEYQYKNGEAVRQWSEIGGPHDLRNYKDSPVWIPDTLVAYLKESGDFKILNKRIKFFDGGCASVYDHALRAVRNLFNNRGMHKMCYMGHGDWNDALNEIGRDGKGESVWLTVALCYAILKMKELAEFLKDNRVVKEMTRMYETLKRDINDNAWDGRWYIYAFNDYGKPIGSKSNLEGKIHLNVQTWAIFTKVAEGDRLKSCLDIIDNEMDNDVGPVLLKPSYTHYDSKIGRITGMLPGFFENGSIYSHGVSFKYKADLVAGRYTQAYKTFKKLMPSNSKNPPGHSSLEPFSCTNFYVGPDGKEKFGVSMYSWFTGSIAWFFSATLEDLFGIKPDFDGLLIEPHFPNGWKAYKVRRYFRGAFYDIDIRLEPSKQKNIIILDGKLQDSNKLPIFNDGKTHYVKVICGKGESLCQK